MSSLVYRHMRDALAIPVVITDNLPEFCEFLRYLCTSYMHQQSRVLLTGCNRNGSSTASVSASLVHNRQRGVRLLDNPKCAKAP